MPRVSFFFCEQCNVLQPAQPGADYFLLLDMCPPPPPPFSLPLMGSKSTESDCPTYIC